MTTRKSPRKTTSLVSSKTFPVDSLLPNRAAQRASSPIAFHQTDRFAGHLLAELISQRNKILIQTPLVAKDEARDETKDGIMDFALLGDRQRRRVVAARDDVGPAAAERELRICDSPDEAAGLNCLHDLHRDIAVSPFLEKEHVAIACRQCFHTLHIRSPAWKSDEIGDRLPYRLGVLPVARASNGDVPFRQQRADNRHRADQRTQAKHRYQEHLHLRPPYALFVANRSSSQEGKKMARLGRRRTID